MYFKNRYVHICKTLYESLFTGQIRKQPPILHSQLGKSCEMNLFVMPKENQFSTQGNLRTHYLANYDIPVLEENVIFENEIDQSYSRSNSLMARSMIETGNNSLILQKIQSLDSLDYCENCVMDDLEERMNLAEGDTAELQKYRDAASNDEESKVCRCECRYNPPPSKSFCDENELKANSIDVNDILLASELMKTNRANPCENGKRMSENRRLSPIHVLT